MGKLEIKNVTLSIGGKNILDNISLDVWEGHIHAIVGPNGAGKSTLASVIMGLSGYRDIKGDIRYNGKSIKKLEVDERAKLGITLGWQEPARFEGLKVTDFVRISARDKSDKGVRDAFLKMGLSPDTYLHRALDTTLSGGERKKLELVSIIAMVPELVLLDEPDSGIDISSIEKIFEAIHILKNAGATVILITHSLAVLKQAEHAFLMCCGRIVGKGSVDKISSVWETHCVPCDHKNKPETGNIYD
jgi:Fe-S cluster assembly ATP-binding protein